MRPNYIQQTNSYGGALVFPITASYNQSISIPLYIQQVSLPIRKPQQTEINTIPVHDELNQSDWATHALFYGSSGVLQQSFSGFFLTPTIILSDGRTGQKYQQYDPTGDQTLLGYSFGDVIWAYLSGRMNQVNHSTFIRTDPSQYFDSSGNIYTNPIIEQYECDYVPFAEKQTFSMTLDLEV